MTVAPEQLGDLEAAVRALRSAYAAGVLGPPSEGLASSGQFGEDAQAA